MISWRSSLVIMAPSCHFADHAASISVVCGGWRATQSVIIDADTPASRARSVPISGAHHSAGILSRCHHFDTVDAPAPMSDAIASRDGQSSIMDRNVVSSVMSISLGHTVLKSKANVSCDPEPWQGHSSEMAERRSETEEKAAFILRVKQAREARFDTQNPMCTILGIAQGTYKQYETRTPLPYRFIPKFCAATGISIDWLLTGEGKGPEVPEIPRQVPKRMGKVPRGRAA